MPEVQAIRSIDSISNVPYRIGYSFRQPQMVKQVTKTNERPYFAMDWAASPQKKKEDLYNKGTLQRFPTVWRRAAKAMNVQGLGVVGNRRELPSFNELGEAPGPTDNATTSSTVTRDVFGFMTNLITSAGPAIAQAQQLEIQKAQIQAAQQPRTFLPQFFTPQDGSGMGMLGWLAIAGGLGIATVLYVRNR